MAEKAGAEATDRMVVDMHKPGGVLLDANGAPAPTKGITSIEPASRAVVANAARPEALEPRAESVEWSKLQLLPPTPPPP